MAKAPKVIDVQGKLSALVGTPPARRATGRPQASHYRHRQPHVQLHH